MGDGAERQHAFVVVVVLLVLEEDLVGIDPLGLGRFLLHDGEAVAAGNQRRPVDEQPQRRRGEQHGEHRSEQAGRIAAGKGAGNLQHHVAEDAAEAGRQRPGRRRRDAAGDRGGEQREAEPGKSPLRQLVDAARGEQEKAPGDRRDESGDRRQAEELHGEVGENRACIAHGVGDGVVGGVAEARIGDVPCGQAGDAERHRRKQAGADDAPDLAAREGADAMARIGQRERCRCP